MRNILYIFGLSLAIASPFISGGAIASQDNGGEEIQLAAAIGMPTSPQTGEDTAATAPARQGSDTGTASAGSQLSTQAMVAIGIGAAVVIGAASGGSSSTTSH